MTASPDPLLLLARCYNVDSLRTVLGISFFSKSISSLAVESVWSLTLFRFQLHVLYFTLSFSNFTLTFNLVMVFIQTKADYDKECKICTRPFTVFRWRPGRDARYKKSEICQTCSKLKNVCQVCLLDLEYGLPVQVRDTALSINSNDAIPKSDVNREYFAEEHDRRVCDLLTASPTYSYG